MILFLSCFILLSVLFSIAKADYTNIDTISFDSYQAFKDSTNGKRFNLDGAYGVQCVDGAAAVWAHVGRWIDTGDTNQAQGTWNVESARNRNAGNEFYLITDVTQIKKGDIVVIRGNWSSSFTWNNNGNIESVAATSYAGHIGFSDADYNSTLRWDMYDQGTDRGFSTHTWAWDGDGFLGAFRYKGWSETIKGSEMTSGYSQAIPDGDYIIMSAAASDKSQMYYMDIAGSDYPAADGANVILTLCNSLFHGFVVLQSS